MWSYQSSILDEAGVKVDGRFVRLSRPYYQTVLNERTPELQDKGDRLEKEIWGLMYRTTFIIILLLMTVVVGGGVFLATWDIPAPSERVEKVLPDDRFPR